MPGMNPPKMIPSALFDLHRWEENYESATSMVGKKRDSSFILNLPDFDIDATNVVKPTDTIRKALTVLKNSPLPFRPKSLSHTDLNEMGGKPTCDAPSVATASTSSMRDDESDLEIDQEEEQEEVPITSLPPDALFVVRGVDFPCHTALLSKEARPLLDILSRDGVLERKTKKQRTSSSCAENQSEGKEEEEPQAWSSPSGITVARLPSDVDSDFFQVFMEFLYTKEIRLKLPEGYHEDDEVEDPWLMGSEDICGDEEEDVDEGEEDVGILPDLLPSSLNDDPPDNNTPLNFLKGAFSLADRFGCSSLKTAIENKIYDEFLFSFTAKELFAWADQNNCTYLKQKALEKIP